MALNATIFKAKLAVTDFNRDYYGDHSLTIARHPSENDLRMMIRIVVFSLNAHDLLEFTKGISSIDEPDLWQKTLIGDIDHWIDLGHPDEKRIRRSCGRAKKVTIYTYHANAAKIWLDGIKPRIERFPHLHVIELKILEESPPIESLVSRNMSLNCMIQDDHIVISNDSTEINLEKRIIFPTGPGE